MQRRRRTGAEARVYPPSVVCEGAVLAEDVVVGAFCFVAAGAVIGRGTRLQGHTSVWDGVVLEEDVFVGPGAQFTNVRRPRAAFPRAPHWDATRVERGASIGAHATVVAPARIGRSALVGAGAVVTGDVPAYAVVVGNPARIVAWACECAETVVRGREPPPELPPRCPSCNPG